MSITEILAALRAHQWLAVSVFVIGMLVRLSKAGVLDELIPAKARPWLALGLGLISGVLDHIVAGGAWGDALLGGVVSGALAIAGHQLTVESMANGVEVGRGWIAAVVSSMGKPGGGTSAVVLFIAAGVSFSSTSCAAWSKAAPYVKTTEDIARAECAAFYSTKQSISIEDAFKTFCAAEDAFGPFLQDVASKQAAAKAGVTAKVAAIPGDCAEVPASQVKP